MQMNWTNFKKIYNMSKINDWFSKEFQRVDSDNDNLSESKSEISVNENVVEVLTEDKFDKDIIPTTKNVGLIGSVIIGGLMFFNGSWITGLLYTIGGIMATLGLCVLLEGISTIIKLLRKISEK
jgi:predicted phage tail protein